MIDLDDPPPGPSVNGGRRLWWILFGVVVGAAAVAIGSVVAPQTPATLAGAPIPPAAAIHSETSAADRTDVDVWRNGAGVMVGIAVVVRPSGDEQVWCRLHVDGQLIISEGTGGEQARCAWSRTAA